MNLTGVRIESDFMDFYDKLSVTGDNVLVYRRFQKEQIPKNEQLRFLKRLGILTIETKAARDIVTASGKLTIYTDTKDDSKNLVLTVSDADMMYPNALASEYYPESNNVINRVIQIGSRRFRVMLYNNSVIQVDELFRGYNMAVGLPIYSIDYISTSNGMLATAFHNVERLDKYRLPLSAEEVISEIAQAMIEYRIF